MSNVARVFDRQNNFPGQPSQDNQPLEDENAPWGTIAAAAMPPMMFQLRFADGRMVSYAYSDVREIHFRNAGRVELWLFAMSKLAIIIEGRHLKDLSNAFGSASIRWIQESDPRDTDTPESEPEITRILVEVIAD